MTYEEKKNMENGLWNRLYKYFNHHPRKKLPNLAVQAEFENAYLASTFDALKVAGKLEDSEVRYCDVLLTKYGF